MRRGLGPTLAILVASALSTGCVRVPNEPFWIDPPPASEPPTIENCERSFSAEDGYEIGFIEFSERGNVFRRDCMEFVLASVLERIRDRPTAIVMFVHGWRHNADPANRNLGDFRRMLQQLSDKQAGLLRGKAVIGLYVGWRGLSYDSEVPGLLTLIEGSSYWGRKAVAQEVGHGGMAELLLRIENQVWRASNQRDWSDAQRADDENIFTVIAHSFGGGIVLSALHDVLLERVVSEVEPGLARRIETDPFGHGVILINPAVEANQLAPLKELVSMLDFGPDQTRLLHVISTEADNATHVLFPLGQRVGAGIGWNPKSLWRVPFGIPACSEASDANCLLEESVLDTTTIGNLEAFRTGVITKGTRRAGDGPAFRFGYRSCVSSEPSCRRCLPDDYTGFHFPVSPNEPVAVIYADDSFMSGHNDIFNPQVRAYVKAVMAEALRRRSRGSGKIATYESLAEPCRGDAFGPCWQYHLGLEGLDDMLDPPVRCRP